MAEPSISVIIPAYQAQHTIARAIDSILAQTVKVSEIIVVDDGSPDDQASLIEQYGSPVILIRQPNQKTAIARNTGIDRARGEFIAFLDADDYWEPEKLERQLTVFNDHPDVMLVASRFYHQEPGKPRRVNLARPHPWSDRVLRQSGSAAFQLGTMLWTGTILARASALADERFVSGLEPAEDRDLWVRLVSKYPTFLMSAPLATAVMEPGGISRRNLEQDCTKMIQVIDRHRPLLTAPSRFVWKAYVRYRWAAIEPSPRIALPLLVRSFVGWPAPIVGIPSMRGLGRSRRVAALLLQVIRGFGTGKSVEGTP